jgi:AcrR family transcriptional regulator
MARPKSDDKRSAILAAATHVIASHGLGASTAAIAQEADVSNGALFIYFPTKVELLNALYLTLKTDRAEASMDGISPRSAIRTQASQMWMNTLHWAADFPDKRRALAQLDVSTDLTPQTRETGHVVMAGVAQLLEKSRENGPMRDVPLAFIVALTRGMTDATIDFMTQDPANADKHGKAAFDALWRMIA